jgi:hypothetical protein
MAASSAVCVASWQETSRHRRRTSTKPKHVMNKGFAPLYTYVRNMDLVGQLIEQEETANRSLSDLVFCAEYSEDDHPGCGFVSVYRLSQAVDAGKLINAAMDNMDQKVWFLESELWQVEKHRAQIYNPPLLQFTALIAFIPDYRPELRVNHNKPILKVKVTDLPRMPQYRQSKFHNPQQPLALAA